MLYFETYSLNMSFMQIYCIHEGLQIRFTQFWLIANHLLPEFVWTFIISNVKHLLFSYFLNLIVILAFRNAFLEFWSSNSEVVSVIEFLNKKQIIQKKRRKCIGKKEPFYKICNNIYDKSAWTHFQNCTKRSPKYETILLSLKRKGT